MPKIGFKINPTTTAPTTMDFEHGGSSTNAACASSSDMAVGKGDARASGRVGTRIVIIFIIIVFLLWIFYTRSYETLIRVRFLRSCVLPVVHAEPSDNIVVIERVG